MYIGKSKMDSLGKVIKLLARTTHNALLHCVLYSLHEVLECTQHSVHSKSYALDCTQH